MGCVESVDSCFAIQSNSKYLCESDVHLNFIDSIYDSKIDVFI